MDATRSVSLIFFVIAEASAQIAPASMDSATSDGNTNNGTVNLGNQVLAGYTTNNGLFQTLSSSKNSADGTGMSLSGSSASSANSASPDFNMSTSYILANGGASSRGNALTGTLNNLDKSNTSSLGGLSGLGSSQIKGTGTGVTISSYVNGNANAQGPTTTFAPCCFAFYGCPGTCLCCIYPFVPVGTTPPNSAPASASQARSNGKKKSLHIEHIVKKNAQQRQASKSLVRQRQLSPIAVQQKAATGKQDFNVRKQPYPSHA